jgi:hypothetical protein
MLGWSKAGTADASGTATSARGRDMYQRYAAVLYRQALLNLDDSVYPRDMAALWRAVLRRLPRAGGNDPGSRLTRGSE